MDVRRKKFLEDTQSAISLCTALNWGFKDFCTDENCLSFNWGDTSKRTFTICVSEDYPEGCLVTDIDEAGNSNIHFYEDTIPIILEQIRDAIIGQKENDRDGASTEWVPCGANASSIDEEDYCSGVDTNEEDALDIDFEKTNINPCLSNDMECVQQRYGNKSLSSRYLESIGEIDVYLHISVEDLEPVIAAAWNLKKTDPLFVSLHLSAPEYLNTSQFPRIHVSQSNHKEIICVCQQLSKILQQYTADLWKSGKLSNAWITEQKAVAAQGRKLMFDDEDSKGSAAEVATVSASLEKVWQPPKPKLDDEEEELEIEEARDSAYSKPVADPNKDPPSFDGGFLVHIVEYVKKRLQTLNEYCVVCDEFHAFRYRSLLKPTVCGRDLCIFAFQTLGVMVDAASDISLSHEVVDLLITLTKAAARSARQSVIFEPYPTVVNPQNANEMALSPQAKDFNEVCDILNHINMDELMNWPGIQLKKNLDVRNVLAYPLLQWIISSNRSFVVKLPADRQLKCMGTPHQFLLMSSPPAQEVAFRQAKAEHGSKFAFHGSGLENWHSIIREGLVIASGTRRELHGTAYGHGIYLSPVASLAWDYANISDYNMMTPAAAKNAHKNGLLGPGKLKCMALCEVVNSGDLHICSRQVWTCTRQENVCTRFFFVFEESHRLDKSVTNTESEDFLKDIEKALQLKFEFSQ